MQKWSHPCALLRRASGLSPVGTEEHRRSATFGRDIRSCDGATVAADLLEEFAGWSAWSLRRRSGHGLLALAHCS
jgi:hypothetical protein